jgi:hypothetical protein
MASFDFSTKSRKARFFFRYKRHQYNKTLDVETERHAERIQALIEETIQDLERGKLTLPDGVDVCAFIISGGKVAARPDPVSTSLEDKRPPAAVATLESVFCTYAEKLTPGSKESNTIETEAIHGRHFKRVLGANRKFESLSLDILQRYVDKRAHEGVVRATIRKELSTLRVVWGWAFKRSHLASPLTWKMSDLTLPKAHEKPPFQTWDQITRKIQRGGLKANEQAVLWECLWLDQAQTLECLVWAKEHVRRQFVYPMFAMAAYTGARRSEMIRSEWDD